MPVVGLGAALPLPILSRGSQASRRSSLALGNQDGPYETVLSFPAASEPSCEIVHSSFRLQSAVRFVALRMDMCRHPPFVAKRIEHSCIAVAIGLIGGSAHLFCSRRNGLLKSGIAVVDKEMQADRGTAVMVRTKSINLRMLVGHHDAGITNLYLGVADASVGALHAHPLGCSERSLIKNNCGGAVAHDETGLQAVVPVVIGFSV